MFVLERQGNTHLLTFLLCVSYKLTGEESELKPHLPVDVEVWVSGRLGGVEAVLVLRSRRPRGVRRRDGNHHEERLVVRLVGEEVQRAVRLQESEQKRNFWLFIKLKK